MGLRSLWSRWGTEGIKIPFIYDPASKQPSITILFPYVLFWIACISLVLLHIFPGMTIATWTSIGFWAMATVLYMFRKLQKAKFEVGGKSITLESGDSSAPSVSTDDPR